MAILKDAKYFNPSQLLIKNTINVSTTNGIAEPNFGMLDRFIRETPNANMATYESVIMNRSNKTTKWQKMTPEKRSLMMKWARKSISRQYQDFEQGRMKIRKAKNEKGLDKVEEARKKESKNKASKRETRC